MPDYFVFDEDNKPEDFPEATYEGKNIIFNNLTIPSEGLEIVISVKYNEECSLSDVKSPIENTAELSHPDYGTLTAEAAFEISNVLPAEVSKTPVKLYKDNSNNLHFTNLDKDGNPSNAFIYEGETYYYMIDIYNPNNKECSYAVQETGDLLKYYSLFEPPTGIDPYLGSYFASNSNSYSGLYWDMSNNGNDTNPSYDINKLDISFNGEYANPGSNVVGDSASAVYNHFKNSSSQLKYSCIPLFNGSLGSVNVSGKSHYYIFVPAITKKGLYTATGGTIPANTVNVYNTDSNAPDFGGNQHKVSSNTVDVKENPVSIAQKVLIDKNFRSLISNSLDNKSNEAEYTQGDAVYYRIDINNPTQRPGGTIGFLDVLPEYLEIDGGTLSTSSGPASWYNDFITSIKNNPTYSTVNFSSSFNSDAIKPYSLYLSGSCGSDPSSMTAKVWKYNVSGPVNKDAIYVEIENMPADPSCEVYFYVKCKVKDTSALNEGKVQENVVIDHDKTYTNEAVTVVPPPVIRKYAINPAMFKDYNDFLDKVNKDWDTSSDKKNYEKNR